jgi:MscS family membrane protein
MRRAWLLAALVSTPVWAQLPATPANPAAQPEAPKDALGRTSPRGTVLGFLVAGRDGNLAAASQYLDTPLKGAAAEELAQQLFTVLDRRLPTRLLELSDSPEGSLSTLKPGQDLIGTISSAQGNVDILVQRLAYSKAGALWLFSRGTLDQIPALFAEVNQIPVDTVLTPFLLKTRIGGVALFNWIGIFVGLPAVYYLTVLLNRFLGLLVGLVGRRALQRGSGPVPKILPVPFRLLLIALIIREILAKVALPLLPRQVWSTIELLIAIVAFVWGAIFLNGNIERHIRKRLLRAGKLRKSAIVRLGRRLVELLIIFIGLLTAVYLLGFNPTAAMAGLGIGGVAVALAAQKTLENVLGGVSIVLDQAVGVGETLRVGNTLDTMTTIGTIEEVGMRSTRIRTRDRSVVSIPNGQLATLSLENLSCKDKFWFFPGVRLRYDTTSGQMRSILEGIKSLLAHHPRVEPESIHVRFLESANGLTVDLQVTDGYLRLYLRIG